MFASSKTPFRLAQALRKLKAPHTLLISFTEAKRHLENVSREAPRKTAFAKSREMVFKLLPRFLANYLLVSKHNTYLEDGLITFHIADFLKDPQFVNAYTKGKATGSWNGGDLRWRVYTGCWAAAHASKLLGDFVECGVNRGGLSRSIMEYVDFNSLDKRFFLLDTYQGFPDDLLHKSASVNHHSYQQCLEAVTETFKPFSRVRIIAGRVPDTLPQVDTDMICFLSLDMNSAGPEVAALRYFWPKLVPSAIVLLDDYAYSESYRPQKDALDNLSRACGFSILTLPTGQGLIVKT